MPAAADCPRPRHPVSRRERSRRRPRQGVGDLTAQLSTALAAAYDRVRYPSSAFDHTHPERLATIAALHGLAAPPPETARVLEIGGGDGLNLLAVAATMPDASVLSVDIAADAVRAGAALAAAAGLANARVERGDVIELADRLDEQFDYVIVHGVYAWVPDAVRTAIMRTIGRVLSPTGVAFVSYNAEPGGSIRRILRDLMLSAIPEDADHDARMTIGREALADFARERPDESSLQRGLREQARLLLRRQPEELAHDELGLFYAPQRFASVVDEAGRHGLAYLNDAERRRRDYGFPDQPAASEQDLVRRIQRRDHEETQFFRNSLFVRRGRSIDRRFDVRRLAPLWLSCDARRTGRHTLTCKAIEVELADDRLCDLLERLGAIHPFRVAIGPLGLDDERLEVLARLFDSGICRFHACPLAGVIESELPRASPLALAQIARGDDRIARLDQTTTRLRPDVRNLLVRLDGTRDLTALAPIWATSPAAATLPLDEAIRALGRQALLLA